MTNPAKALMQQYCSVCKSRYDMTVVSENADDEVIWLKCPNCQGILPHMPEADDAEEGAEATDRDSESVSESATAEELDFDVDSAKPYTPQGRFEVGDVLHHRGWNDYGIVLEKQELPGGRGLLKVRFVEQGEMQLVEGAPA